MPDPVGLGDLYRPGSPTRTMVLYALFVVISWKYFGFHMILLLAGLQAIPRELDRGGRDRRRDALAGVPLHHPAAAGPDHPGLASSCR